MDQPVDLPPRATPNPTKGELAREAILELLAEGPLLSEELFEILEKRGHKRTTVHRERTQLRKEGRVVLRRYGSTSNPYTTHLADEKEG